MTHNVEEMYMSELLPAYEGEHDETLNALRHIVEEIEAGVVPESDELTEAFGNAVADAADAHGWTVEQAYHEVETLRLEAR